MSQNLTQTQDATSLSSGGNTSTGFPTGTTCTTSGTYRCSNKYMDTIVVYAAGDTFFPGPDGRKTTWYPLTTNLSTNVDGGFSSQKVAPGTI